MQIESTIFTFMTQFTRKNIFKCCLLLNRTRNYPYRMPCTIFFMFFIVIRKENNLSLSIFCQKLPFLAQNVWFFFLKSKNGVLDIFLKSNILCTKILETVKFFFKSKKFLKLNMLKSKNYCTFSLQCQFSSFSLYKYFSGLVWNYHFFKEFLSILESLM